MKKDQQAIIEMLYRISREVADAIELRTVLTRLLFAALHNVGGERASIVVLDDNARPVDAAIVYGIQVHEHTTRQLRDTIERGLAGWVIRNHEPAFVPNTSNDDRWLHREDDDEDRTGAKSSICVPLLVRKKLVGVLTLVHPTPNAYTEDDLALMQSIADQAGVAVLNARLYAESQSAQRRYHELFQDSIDPIIITDLGGRITEVNRRAIQMCGCDAETLRSQAVTSMHTADSDKLGSDYAHVGVDAAIVYESSLQSRHGKSIPVEVYVRRLDLEETQSLQWIFRDITSRHELDSLRNDLMSMIYHDLRSPLSNIVSSLDILTATLTEHENDTVRAILEIARHSIERIQRLVSSLLDINRLEAGQPLVNRRSFPLKSIFEDGIQSIRPGMEGRKQTIEIRFDTALPDIDMDVDMIRRVVINLMDNAVKYTPSKGKIEAGARREGGFAKVWVKDSGLGIPQIDRERIFEKFARLQSENSPSGLGLGLAFCRLAVENHGGRIWVESEPGQGATFIFTLPIHTS